jgi:polyphosphate kinase 1
VISRQDILVHHPYESFGAVTDFLRAAAEDPAVVAISMTIYRTGQISSLMESLILAARSGKEVTVVVELMARFDEEININWASRLEEVGAHVVFGVVGNKTHAKMCLVVRKEKAGLRRYVHIGTGNYHPRTASLYEDFGLFTSDSQICQDAHEVFHQLTGLGKARNLRKIWQSPFTLHANVLKAVRRETLIAKAGRKAHIMAKMNSLVELAVVESLYAASQAGVKIDLIVRGTCVLRPGVPGLSENIRVRSTIGRFLEHSRLFYFRNDGAEDVFISSADWMDRNFFSTGGIGLSHPRSSPQAPRHSRGAEAPSDGQRLELADALGWILLSAPSTWRWPQTRPADPSRLSRLTAKPGPEQQHRKQTNGCNGQRRPGRVRESLVCCELMRRRCKGFDIHWP